MKKTWPTSLAYPLNPLPWVHTYNFWLDPTFSLQIRSNLRKPEPATTVCFLLSFFICCYGNPSRPHSGDISSSKSSWLTTPEAYI